MELAEAASIHMHARLALILYPFLTRPRFIPRIPKRFHLWIDANGKRWFPPCRPRSPTCGRKLSSRCPPLRSSPSYKRMNRMWLRWWRSLRERPPRDLCLADAHGEGLDWALSDCFKRHIKLRSGWFAGVSRRMRRQRICGHVDMMMAMAANEILFWLWRMLISFFNRMLSIDAPGSLALLV